MNISELQDFKLTEDEWHSLMHMGEFDPIRAHMDMLVLAGLAVRTHIHPPEWDLTEAGHAACNAIDLILDWDDFVFVGDGEDTEPFGIIQLESPSEAPDTVFLNGEPIERSEAVELASRSNFLNLLKLVLQPRLPSLVTAPMPFNSYVKPLLTFT